MQPDKASVIQFLKDFKEKMKFWDVLFLDNRSKNFHALAELEITPNQRKTVLEKLTVSDYSEGPLPEEWHGSKEMWVFGVTVKKKEVYIKITLGLPGSQTICISFHIAEHPLHYPFKKQ